MEPASRSAGSADTTQLAEKQARLIDALCLEADAAVAAAKELAERSEDTRSRRAFRTAECHLEKAKGIVEAVRRFRR